MPRLPQRSSLYAVLRPLGAAVAITGLVLAVGSSSGGTAAAARVDRHSTSTTHETTALPVPTRALQPVHVARSLQRGEWVRPVPGPVTSWFGPARCSVGSDRPATPPDRTCTSRSATTAGRSTRTASCGGTASISEDGHPGDDAGCDEAAGDASAMIDVVLRHVYAGPTQLGGRDGAVQRDRKSTRLNSSHRTISYAVFCLKKKNQS